MNDDLIKNHPAEAILIGGIAIMGAFLLSFCIIDYKESILIHEAQLDFNNNSVDLDKYFAYNKMAWDGAYKAEIDRLVAMEQVFNPNATLADYVKMESDEK